MLAFLLVTPAAPDLADAVVTEHIRSLQAEHLLDVISTDQHTVKPWFNGKLDFAPPIVDLAANGFPLSGGRLDYLAGHTVAALVYHHKQHPINLFIWPNSSGRSSAPPTCVERAGYHLCNWSNQAMNYWAISDLNAAELSQFAGYWREH
jgi:anti-sigma factor RsiW